MRVRIPGFPAEVSGPVELPDIGELLMAPAFQGILADDYRKHATQFQRCILDRLPLKHDKKYVVVRSGVWLLSPGMRSHVNREGNWHIDSHNEHDYLEPEQRVYILSSPCSALTEFNLNPLEIEIPSDETRTRLCARLCADEMKYGVIGRPIEPCRVYTFTNHLHRAVDPKRVEFRYFLRVRETDVPEAFKKAPIRSTSLRDARTGVESPHMEWGARKLSIYYPSCLS
jgi:hypothetical protein